MKKIISLILTLSILITMFAGMDFSVSASVSESEEQTEEYIYYSDLFYGYSHYLASTPYLTDYYNDTKGILDTVYTEYMDSSLFAWSNIKNSLSMATNLKEWTKMVTDAFGLTTFTYEKALDAANVDFATKLTGGSEIAKAYGTELKWVKKINDILKVYDTFDKNYVVSSMTETEVFTAMFATINDTAVITHIEKTTITALQEDILPHISTITSKLSKGADILTAAKTIAMGIMMEDFRMELIDDILSNTPSGTMLYDGMSRLKSQLRNGFVSYFLDNYLTDKVLNEIADKVVKKITSSLLEDQAGIYALIGAITKVASWIVFDCIFNVPDIDDLTKQMVLSEYACNLYDLIENKVTLFSEQFENDDIFALETLATAYSAATNAALEASDKLKLSTNEDNLATITDKYSNVNFYNEWIESAKAFIKKVPVESRIQTDFGTWQFVDENVVLNFASDKIEIDNVYFLNNTFKGNITTWAAEITIPNDTDIVIDGNVTLKLTGLENYGKLHVTGNLSLWSSSSYSSDSYTDLTNYAELIIGGNLDVDWHSDLIQTEDMATLKIGGNFTATSASNKLSGTIIFNGSYQQSITHLKGTNIEVTNAEGIKYLNDLNLYGKYTLYGNPLDNNGYYTKLYSGASFGDNSDYKEIYICHSGPLTTSVKGNITTWAAEITIPNDTDIVIDGNVTLKLTDLENYGKLHVTGNLSLWSSSSYSSDSYTDLTNYAELIIGGNLDVDWHSDLIQTEDMATLKIGGNFTATSASNKLSGTIVFNGSQQQLVYKLNACKIEIDNKSNDGIVFQTSINPTTFFNHNGNVFHLEAGGEFVDYDGDGLKDNVDPEPTVGNPCTIVVDRNYMEYGTVSTELIETIGGTEHTVIATPTFKYKFVKWVNASGTTVSTNSKYTFVAKNNETLTAVFEKRSQNITVNTEGGVIIVPSSAVIESEVSVSFAENEGYIYTDGSLNYNGNPIENGKFIMPDEPVTITAEFVYNDHYFALKEKIAEAADITYENYSAESFADLQTAISNANGVLENHITQSVSNEHITELQSAINGLIDKYIVSISVTNNPELYIGVESHINNLNVLITYDNGTTEYTTEFTVESFDSWQLGDQEITVWHGDFSTTTIVTVALRRITQSSGSVERQLYLGEGTVYEPKPELTYVYTGETLVEGVDYILTYSNNSAPGIGRIIVTGIGNYFGKRYISFIIYCEHNYEVVEYSAPSCLENGYRKETCNICGDTQEYYYEYCFTENLPESAHNYSNSTNITYTYQAAGAEYLDLLFSSSTKVESNCDYIYIYDSAGTQIGKYTGTALASKTIRVTGDSVKIKITSDSSVVYYGFSLDSVTATYPYTELKAIGHTVDDWIIVKEPTICEDGLKQQMCTECEEVVAEEIIAKLMYGDANADGEINALDLSEIRKALLSSNANHEYGDNFDANTDGEIDIRDLVHLKKMLAGIV